MMQTAETIMPRDREWNFGILLRPFWRDWVLAGVLIAVGFMFGAPGAPLAGWPGLIVMATGATIFLTASVHAIWTTFFSR